LSMVYCCHCGEPIPPQAPECPMCHKAQSKVCPACGFPNSCNATMCENCWWVFIEDCPNTQQPPHAFPQNDLVCDMCGEEPMVRCGECDHMYYSGGNCQHNLPPVPPQ
jgi:hypothetical protein